MILPKAIAAIGIVAIFASGELPRDGRPDSEIAAAISSRAKDILTTLSQVKCDIAAQREARAHKL